MKTLEHTIRDVLSGKREQDLIEEVNNDFINIINTVYEEKLSEEKFIELYNLYIDHLIEQDDSLVSRTWQGTKSLAGKAATVGGKALGPALAAFDFYDRYHTKNQPWYHAAGGTATSVIGGIAGTAVGGIPGALIGGAGGGMAYDKLFGLEGNDKARTSIIGGAGGYATASKLGLGKVGKLTGTVGGYLAGSAASPDPKASPPTSNTQPTTAAPATPPVSPPGANTNVAPTTTQPAEKRGGTSGAVRSLDQKLNQPETPTPPSAPTPAKGATAPSSPAPVSTTPTSSPASTTGTTPPVSSRPATGTTTPSSPAAPSTKSQEPPESARKQKPTTSSGSSYSGNMIGDYGKDNSWVQSAFNRG